MIGNGTKLIRQKGDIKKWNLIVNPILPPLTDESDEEETPSDPRHQPESVKSDNITLGAVKASRDRDKMPALLNPN